MVLGVFEEDISDVALHGQAACVLVVVPSDVYAGKFGPQPICGDLIGLLEGLE